MAGAGQDKAAPGQVQGGRGEQHHDDQALAGPGGSRWCGRGIAGIRGGDLPGRTVIH
jgi:hypothetical protein